MKHFYTSPRYDAQHGSDSESSTHSVRVSRLIEKIKQSQRSKSGGHHAEGGFSYVHAANNDLIYSRVERDHRNDSIGKRTVRERVQQRVQSSPPGPRHRTTVLLNNEDSGGDTSPYDYESFNAARANNRGRGQGHGGTSGHGGGHTGGLNRGAMFRGASPPRARYFGEETDYEYDRVLSKSMSEQPRGGGPKSSGVPRNSGVPKIILHEEAVAEIPNGNANTNHHQRSPSREFEDPGAGGNRFLGGLLTLKRNKGGKGGSSSLGGAGGSMHGTIRSTRSPSSRYVPGEGNHGDSSPKYYVPYYRSTPTLYESQRYERDRMSSAGGSVLSNSSYVNKHVSRSMSMKAPWEPKHRVNEINYYNDVAREPKQDVGAKKKPGLARSKSMPGKKLSTIIGSWVSKNNARRGSAGERGEKGGGGSSDQEKLIGSPTPPAKKDEPKVKNGRSNSLFSLLRFGRKSGKSAKETGKTSTGAYRRGTDVVDTPPRVSMSPSRGSAARDRGSELRVGGGGAGVRSSYSSTLQHNRSTGTLSRNPTGPYGGKHNTIGGRGGGGREYY